MDRKLVKTFAQNRMLNDKWMNFISLFDTEAIQKGYISGAAFELTAFCTLKCPMCYVRIDQEKANMLGGKPCTAKEWINLAGQFRDQGGVFLLLTGGEAMSRPDFPEIYTEVSRMGLYISLFTNGTTVDDRMLELLKKRPPAMVGITIYGASEDTYQSFGGSKGSFQRAVDGLDRLFMIPNLAIDVRFTVCRDNYRDLRRVYELTAMRNKLLSVDFGSCAPVRGACSDARRQRLSEEQVKEVNEILETIARPVLDEYDKMCGRNGNNKADVEDGRPAGPELPRGRGWWCKGGKNNVYIAWDGRMYPCDMSGFPYTFPLEQGFKEAAEDIRRQVDSLLFPERCMSCANQKKNCTCIPKAQNEMKDCARMGERCNYIPV